MGIKEEWLKHWDYALTLKGRDRREVVAELEDKGHKFRIVRIDGKYFPFAQEVDIFRINMDIDDEVVTSVSLG